MGKHLRTGSARRVRVMGAVAALAATGITASVALTHADATTSNRTAPVADLDRTRTFACPGTLLLLTRAGASALRLTCVNGVSPVGRDTVTAVRSGAVARTGLPAGTARGTLLVTMVQSPATSAVSVPGWTRAYDQVSGPRGVRLSTWYRVATGGETEARADVTPAARASMLTTALAGARASAPVAFAAAAGGLRAPSAAAAVDGGRWLLGLGADAAGVRARIDGPGASPARVVRNGDSRTAQAMVATPRGVVPATTWTARGVRQAVSGLLVVAPRPPAAVPSGSVAVVAGRTADATCERGPLTYVVANPTTVRVRCPSGGSSAPTSAPGQTAPTSSPSVTSSTTTTPPGATGSPTTGTTSPTTSTGRPPTSTTAAPGTSTTAPAPAGHVCTSPVFRTSDPNGGWSEGGYYVHNNMWNIAKYPSLKETLEACSHASWNVTATADNSSGNGEVKTYPNAHVDYHGSGANGEPAWSSFRSMRSTFAAQGPGVGIYDIAYDIWMNGVPGNREVMIWTENHNQRPAGNVVAAVTMSGITWDVWATGDNGYLAFVPKSPVTSGSLDLKAMIDYLIGQGRVPASSTLGQVGFGVEIVSTDGKPATFRFTDFSVTSS